jgi:hypothetical protein
MFGKARINSEGMMNERSEGAEGRGPPKDGEAASVSMRSRPEHKSSYMKTRKKQRQGYI